MLLLESKGIFSLSIVIKYKNYSGNSPNNLGKAYNICQTQADKTLVILQALDTPISDYRYIQKRM